MTALVPAGSLICQVDPALSSELPTLKSSCRPLKRHSHWKWAEISMDDQTYNRSKCFSLFILCTLFYWWKCQCHIFTTTHRHKDAQNKYKYCSKWLISYWTKFSADFQKRFEKAFTDSIYVCLSDTEDAVSFPGDLSGQSILVPLWKCCNAKSAISDLLQCFSFSLCVRFQT